MDTESQGEVEKEQSIVDGLAAADDIQFEDVFNIDELHKQLKQEATTDNLGEQFSDVEKTLEAAISQSPLVTSQEKNIITPVKIDANIKKYVVYVDSDNVDYMESLSINERKDVINKVLREQNLISEKQKALRRKSKFLSHLILAVLTFIVCFPILFIVVNKAAKISLENYTGARENISKLYKERGKIKPH